MRPLTTVTTTPRIESEQITICSQMVTFPSAGCLAIVDLMTPIGSDRSFPTSNRLGYRQDPRSPEFVVLVVVSLHHHRCQVYVLPTVAVELLVLLGDVVVGQSLVDVGRLRHV